MYKLRNLPLGGQDIIRIEDGASIPMNEGNTDYQAYLKWVADGNTPEEAE